MRPIILICARKGSKGVPNKHFRQFNGLPLIEWTLIAADDFSCGAIDVAVAGDSEVTLELARQYGFMAIERDPKFATDEAGKVDALRSAFKQVDNFKKYDYIIDLDATNPCRKLLDIYNCQYIFEEKRPKTLFSAVKSKKNAYFNQVERYLTSFKLTSEVASITSAITGCLQYIRPFRRQDARQTYDVNSNIYIYDSEWLLDQENKIVITDKSEIYIMPDWTFCDIDNEVDFKIAEFLHREYILHE